MSDTVMNMSPPATRQPGLFSRFVCSMTQILRNRHVHRGAALGRYAAWQSRKALDLFPFEQRISRSRIIAPDRRCLISAMIHIHGLYDYNNMRLICHLLRKGDVFFDVGAHIGAFTLLASEQPDVRVYAFEPHPVTYERLRRNVELNGRENVRPYNLALGSREEAVFLTDQPGSGTNYLVTSPDEPAIPVRCTRAETICREQQVSPRIAKIDVEGFEYGVLVGFGPFLHDLALILLEMNGLSDLRSIGLAETHRWLLANGFTGPWSCDFDSRMLVPRHPRSYEDSLYLSSHGRKDLESMGFTVVNVACDSP